MQFWGRDVNGKENDTLDEYFLNLLASLTNEIKIPNFDDSQTEDWIAAIKKAKANSAPGIDGITFAELKMLPNIFQKL